MLALAALYLIWGSTYLALNIATHGFPPLTMLGLRFVIAGVLMFAFLRLRRIAPPLPAQWSGAALVGTLLLLIFHGGLVLGLCSVPSGLAAVCVATVPLWTALCGGFWGRWPTRREWWGLALGLLGVAFLNLDAGLRGQPFGALLLLGASAAWALGTVWSRHVPYPSGAMGNAAQMLLGGALLLVAGLLSGERLTAVPPPAALWAFAYLLVFGTFVGFNAYMYLLDHVSPAVATSYAYVNPLVALALGVFVGGERLEMGVSSPRSSF